MIEESLSPKIGNGYIALWRARCITRYDPELLPAEAVPLEEEVTIITFSILSFFLNMTIFIKLH